MTYEARIETVFETGQARILLVNRTGGDLTGGDLYWFQPGGPQVRVKTGEAEVIGPNFKPLAILPHEALPTLLAALSTHLGAVEHPQQLRADYNHLRQRHDLLVDHLMAMERMK